MAVDVVVNEESVADDPDMIVQVAGEVFSLKNLVHTVPAQDTLQGVFEVLASICEDMKSNAMAILELEHKMDKMMKLDTAVQALEKTMNNTQMRVQMLEDAVNTHTKRIQKIEKDAREKEAVFNQLQVAVKDFNATKTVIKADMQELKETVSQSIMLLDNLSQDHKNLSQSCLSDISDLRHQCAQLRFDMRTQEGKLIPTIQEKVDTAMVYWEKKMGGSCGGCKKLTIVVDEMSESTKILQDQVAKLEPLQEATLNLVEQSTNLSGEIDLMRKNWMWSFAQEMRSVSKVHAEFERKLDSAMNHPLRSYYGGVNGDGGHKDDGDGENRFVPHPHDTPLTKDIKSRGDTLSMAPHLRIAEIVKTLDEHKKQLEDLSSNKADARAVWTEIKTRPTFEQLHRIVDESIPSMEQKIMSRTDKKIQDNLKDTKNELRKVSSKTEYLSERAKETVTATDLEVRLAEWGSMMEARADNICIWCRRPKTSKLPGEKICGCQMAERSHSRAASDTSIYGTDNLPYRSTSVNATNTGQTPPPVKYVKRPKTVQGEVHSSLSKRNHVAAVSTSGKIVTPDTNGVVVSVQYMTLGSIDTEGRPSAQSR